MVEAIHETRMRPGAGPPLNAAAPSAIRADVARQVPAARLDAARPGGP